MKVTLKSFQMSPFVKQKENLRTQRAASRVFGSSTHHLSLSARHFLIQATLRVTEEARNRGAYTEAKDTISSRLSGFSMAVVQSFPLRHQSRPSLYAAVTPKKLMVEKVLVLRRNRRPSKEYAVKRTFILLTTTSRGHTEWRETWCWCCRPSPAAEELLSSYSPPRYSILLPILSLTQYTSKIVV